MSDDRIRKSRAQEKRIARRTNGALNGGSGSGGVLRVEVHTVRGIEWLAVQDCEVGPWLPGEEAEGECFIWTGGTSGDGYPVARLGERRMEGKWYVRRKVPVYRWVLEKALGRTLKKSEQACHRCDRGAVGCVRLSHLAWGSSKDNVLDSVRKGRHKNPVLVGKANPNYKHGRKSRCG